METGPSACLCSASFTRRQQVFSQLFIWDNAGIVQFEASGQYVISAIAQVSGNYYQALQITPALGRFIGERDVNLNGSPSSSVAVITYRAWRTWYNGDPHVLGKIIRTTSDNHSFTIIGVEPKNFAGLIIDRSTDITTPVLAVSPRTLVRLARVDPGNGMRTQESSAIEVSRRECIARRVQYIDHMNQTANTRAAASDYREYAPPPLLAQHLLCFWTQSITGCREYAQRVLPDGCIDIVFINDEAPIVVGPWVKAFTARLPAATKIIGARWHPGRAPALLGLPAAELLNQSVALRDLWNRTLASSFERVSELPNLRARRSAFETTLLNRLAHAVPGDPTVNASIQWLARHPHGRIGQLSRWVGISSRQLQRRFSASVGYGPKAFQSILRFQRLLHLADRASHPRSLAELSADVGYADQAHMTREVQRLSGCPPTVLFQSAQSALQMSDFFKTPPDERC